MAQLRGFLLIQNISYMILIKYIKCDIINLQSRPMGFAGR